MDMGKWANSFMSGIPGISGVSNFFGRGQHRRTSMLDDAYDSVVQFLRQPEVCGMLCALDDGDLGDAAGLKNVLPNLSMHFQRRRQAQSDSRRTAISGPMLKYLILVALLAENDVQLAAAAFVALADLDTGRYSQGSSSLSISGSGSIVHLSPYIGEALERKSLVEKLRQDHPHAIPKLCLAVFVSLPVGAGCDMVQGVASELQPAVEETVRWALAAATAATCSGRSKRTSLDAATAAAGSSRSKRASAAQRSSQVGGGGGDVYTAAWQLCAATAMLSLVAVDVPFGPASLPVAQGLPLSIAVAQQLQRLQLTLRAASASPQKGSPQKIPRLRDAAIANKLAESFQLSLKAVSKLARERVPLDSAEADPVVQLLQSLPHLPPTAADDRSLRLWNVHEALARFLPAASRPVQTAFSAHVASAVIGLLRSVPASQQLPPKQLEAATATLEAAAAAAASPPTKTAHILAQARAAAMLLRQCMPQLPASATTLLPDLNRQAFLGHMQRGESGSAGSVAAAQLSRRVLQLLASSAAPVADANKSVTRLLASGGCIAAAAAYLRLPLEPVLSLGGAISRMPEDFDSDVPPPPHDSFGKKGISQLQMLHIIMDTCRPFSTSYFAFQAAAAYIGVVEAQIAEGEPLHNAQLAAAADAACSMLHAAVQCSRLADPELQLGPRAARMACAAAAVAATLAAQPRTLPHLATPQAAQALALLLSALEAHAKVLASARPGAADACLALAAVVGSCSEAQKALSVPGELQWPPLAARLRKTGRIPIKLLAAIDKAMQQQAEPAGPQGGKAASKVIADS